jgi:hypothetical protein
VVGDGKGDWRRDEIGDVSMAWVAGNVMPTGSSLGVHKILFSRMIPLSFLKEM